MEPETEKTEDQGRVAGLVELVAITLVVIHGGVVAWLAPKGYQIEITPALFVGGGIQSVGMILLVAGLLRRHGGVLWPLYKPAHGWVLECITAALLTTLLLLISYVVASGLQGLPDTVRLDPWPQALKYPLIDALRPIYTILGVIEEELIFRAYLIVRIAQHLRVGNAASVLIAAAIFAVAHGYALRGTIDVLLVGILLGGQYAMTRSLPCLVLAHWACNVLISS